MDRFLLPPATVRRREEILVTVNGHLAGRSTPVVIPKRKQVTRGPWARWTQEQKSALVERFSLPSLPISPVTLPLRYKNLGKSYLRLCRNVPNCPPRSTVCGWVKQMGKGSLSTFGRPGLLTPTQEAELLEVLKMARSRGTVLDADTVSLFAAAVGPDASQASSSSDAAVAHRFTRDWVTHMKRRHGLSNLRASSSDKPPSSPAEIQV